MAARRIKKLEDKTDINISPMIDMVFILLIFFIVTTVFVDERGVDIDKPIPNPNPPTTENEDPIKIHITKTGEVMIGSEKIGVGGVRANVSRMLKQSRTPDELPVILEVEAAARSGLMVRVMDEAKLGGARKISVSEASE
jgi:biopolymer transport protein ExbD